MPGTARERGLADPFDPEQAIAASAALLADLKGQFGNLGLAAAAYNAGPTRVQTFLDGRGGLPMETQSYVFQITARTAEDWAEDRRRGASPAGEVQDQPPHPCLMVTALLRRPGELLAGVEGPFAPGAVQLAGNFSRAVALASYQRARGRLAGILGDVQPMVLGSRLRHRGRAVFYRVRVPAPTRAAANMLCDRIRGAGGPASCCATEAVLPSLTGSAVSRKSQEVDHKAPMTRTPARGLALLLGLLAGGFWLAATTPASADLRLCNSTGSRVGAAIGYKDGEGWTTEGWWNIRRVPARSSCAGRWWRAIIISTPSTTTRAANGRAGPSCARATRSSPSAASSSASPAAMTASASSRSTRRTSGSGRCS